MASALAARIMIRGIIDRITSDTMKLSTDKKNPNAPKREIELKRLWFVVEDSNNNPQFESVTIWPDRDQTLAYIPMAVQKAFDQKLVCELAVRTGVYQNTPTFQYIACMNEKDISEQADASARLAANGAPATPSLATAKK